MPFVCDFSLNPSIQLIKQNTTLTVSSSGPSVLS